MKRSPANPILTRADIPDVPPHAIDVTSVFNPGAIRVGDRYLLLLRVQTRGRETVLMIAESPDGERFTVRPRLVRIEGLERVPHTIYHIYDPRLTSIDGTVYAVFAADTDVGCRLGIARTTDFDPFEDMQTKYVAAIENNSTPDVGQLETGAPARFAGMGQLIDLTTFAPRASGPA